MQKYRQEAAQRLMDLLCELPMVKECRLYGSLVNGTADDFSDIDIEVDVSGYDNGRFLLEVAEWVSARMPVSFSDYAPSLAPEQYVLSLALDERHPFLCADLRCVALPHHADVSGQMLKAKNQPTTHLLKLWVANTKHWARGKDCRQDVLRMADKMGIDDPGSCTTEQLLAAALAWLEARADQSLRTYIASCSRAFEEIRKREKKQTELCKQGPA